jgi:hypothetical protein
VAPKARSPPERLAEQYWHTESTRTEARRRSPRSDDRRRLMLICFRAMPTVRALPFVACAALIGCASLRAERDVLRMNEHLVRAIRDHDATSLRQLTAPWFFAQMAFSKLDRTEWLAAVSAGNIAPRAKSNVSATFEGPNRVTVCGEGYRELARNGAWLQERESCDEWELHDGRWQLVATLPVAFEL